MNILFIVLSSFTFLVSCGESATETKSTRTTVAQGQDGSVDPASGDATASDDTAPASENPTSKDGLATDDTKGDPDSAEKPNIVLLTTFADNTKAIWKPCADACHSEGAKMRRPYLDVYEDAKNNVKRKTRGHKNIEISAAQQLVILDWIADGLLENQPVTTTFEGHTKAIWKPCADACHSLAGMQKPYLDVYQDAKDNAKFNTSGHNGLTITPDQQLVVLDWINDGLLER